METSTGNVSTLRYLRNVQRLIIYILKKNILLIFLKFKAYFLFVFRMLYSATHACTNFNLAGPFSSDNVNNVILLDQTLRVFEKK